MQRRTLLAGLTAAVAGLSGCVGDGPPDDGDSGGGDDDGDGTGDGTDDTDGTGDGTDDTDGTGDGTDGDDDGEPVLTSVDLDRTTCEEPETASVAFDEGAGEIRVVGCVLGNNGCHVPVLVEPALDAGETRAVADGRLRATVTTVEDADSDEACTQALTELGYEATFGFEGTLPSSVEVVHETHDGERTVATADR